MKDRPLWKIQEKAVDFVLSQRASMLNMDMGTGKTRVALEVIHRSRADRVLVVAPKSVVPVWGVEAAKIWDPSTYRILELGRGSLKDRDEELRAFFRSAADFAGPRVVVVNYDVLWRLPLFQTLQGLRWDWVILDESHRAKSHSSKTSKACYRIGRSATHRLCLSGTPMANSPLDVFGQYRFLDDSIFGTSWIRFTDSFAIRGGPERRFIVGVRNLDELGHRFHSIAFTCTKNDIREEADLLPPPTVENRYGTLSPPARRIYSALSREFVSDYLGDMIIAANPLVRLLRFQQITSGFVETSDLDGRNRKIEEVDGEKQKLLRELIEDLPPAEPVVLFYKFRQDIRNISKAIGDLRPLFELSGDRNDLEAWKAQTGGPGGVLMVQYQAGNAGIDLTFSSYLIYYSFTFSLSEYQQSQARVYRPGQTRPVTVSHLILRDTLDEIILRALGEKRDLIDLILSERLKP